MNSKGRAYYMKESNRRLTRRHHRCVAIDWNIVVSGYSMNSKERAYYKTESN